MPVLPESPKARRRKIGQPDSFPDNVSRDLCAAGKRRRELSQRSRGLNSVAALPRQPKEALRRRIKADHRRAVAGEVAQPRPYETPPPHLQRRRRFQPVDRKREVKILRSNIARRRWSL